MELGEKINTRLIFDGFAALAAETGDFVRAAQLSGAAESLGATIGYTIEPAEQIFRDAYQGKLRSALSREEFEINHEIGRNLSTEEARELAYSKNEPEPPTETRSAVRSSPTEAIETEPGIFGLDRRADADLVL